VKPLAPHTRLDHPGFAPAGDTARFVRGAALFSLLRAVASGALNVR